VRLNRAALLLIGAGLLLVADRARAAIKDLRDATFAAVGDGAVDDSPALARALAVMKPGDTLLVPPGVYRIVLTADPLRIPAGVTLWGQIGKSKFILHSAGGKGDHREFLHLGSGATLDGITIERGGEFPAVLLPLFGDASAVTLRNCTIVGNASRFGGYCHAIQVGVGTLKNLVLDGVRITDCTYGLFQQNDATGTVDGVTVARSFFERNTASDLEFNSPRGTMRNVVVRDCLFRDNQCRSGSAGFAVGFANVQGGRVEDCDMRGYGSEALHVEDRSSDIRLSGNTIIGASRVQPNGVILVISGSTSVRVERNVVDARTNENGPHLVLVTAGGKELANPSDVSVTGNILVNGRATRTWYVQPGSGGEPTGSVVVPAGAAPSK
jgi:hypothetical protein